MFSQQTKQDVRIINTNSLSQKERAGCENFKYKMSSSRDTAEFENQKYNLVISTDMARCENYNYNFFYLKQHCMS